MDPVALFLASLGICLILTEVLLAELDIAVSGAAPPPTADLVDAPGVRTDQA